MLWIWHPSIIRQSLKHLFYVGYGARCCGYRNGNLAELLFFSTGQGAWVSVTSCDKYMWYKRSTRGCDNTEGTFDSSNQWQSWVLTSSLLQRWSLCSYTVFPSGPVCTYSVHRGCLHSLFCLPVGLDSRYCWEGKRTVLYGRSLCHGQTNTHYLGREKELVPVNFWL